MWPQSCSLTRMNKHARGLELVVARFTTFSIFANSVSNGELSELFPPSNAHLATTDRLEMIFIILERKRSKTCCVTCFLIIVHKEYTWGRGYFWLRLSIRRFPVVRRRGEDQQHSTHTRWRSKQPFKDKSCTKINKMARRELWDAVSVFAAVLFMYGCRILKSCKEEGAGNDTLSTKQWISAHCPSCSHTVPFVCLFSFSTSFSL